MVNTMKSKNRKLICFEGMDGSGKSTLSIIIADDLRQYGYSVYYLRWLDGEDTILKKMLWFLSQGNAKSSSNDQEKPIHKSISKKNILTHFYVALVLFNYLWFGLVRIRIARFIKNYDIFIIDRYYFDVVLSICREFGYSPSTLEKMLNLFKKILPEPDLFIFIIVSSSLAYQRKPDEFLSLEQAQIKEQLHNELFLLIGNQIKCHQIYFDNTQGVDESAKELGGRIQSYLLI